MQNVWKILPFVAIVSLVAAGCGSSGTSTSSDTPTISDVSQLPKATSPMASATANLAKSAGTTFKANAATTGISVRGGDEDDFDYASSVGSCNTFNVVKQGISAASQADMILCYISQMNSNFAGMTDSDGNVINIYDGEYHIFNLNMVGDAGAPNRIKMKIVKTGSSITDFKMWMCKLSGSTLYQNEYTDQAISGSTVNMTALGLFSEGENEGRHYVGVSGTLNASRVYTTKTITTKNYGGSVGSDPSQWSEAILTQTPSLFNFSGYNKGSHQGGTHEDTAIGLGQMIGDTGGLATLAMGDGAVKYAQSGTSSEGTFTQNGVNAWNGDTTAPEAAADNDYYTTAYASTYSTPAVQTSAPTITFSTAQTWDCTDDVSAGIYTLPASNAATIATACAEYTFGHDYINCYTDIGACNGDNFCGERTGDDLTACRLCFTDGEARRAGTATEDCLTTFCAGDTGCLASVSQMCTPL